MISSHVVSDYSGIKLGHINWRQYNLLKKKAMEQEFSWSGLVLSLSIAFFVVIFSAYILSGLYSIVELGGFEISNSGLDGIYYEAVLNTSNSSSFIYSSLT